MTKLAAMPIYGKNLKKNLLRNQKDDDLETWYAALGTRCSNDEPGLILSYFMANSILVPYAFVWEKGKTMDFSESIVVYDLKLATNDRSDKKFLLTSKLCPLGAVCPPAPGLYTCIKSWKELYKIRLQISLKLATNG